MTAKSPIALIDLAAQQNRIRPAIDLALKRVLDHGQYIMGPEVAALEKDLAAFCGARHVISCSNGTDALLMVMMAKGIGPGDAIICPAFTFTATPEVIGLIGATPVMCDVEDGTFNIDPVRLPDAIAAARSKGLTPRAIIAVDLFGQPADYAKIQAIAEHEGLWILADAAQSFGASYKDRAVGTLGLATSTSFFPAKPLGCYGDGGAICTDDDGLAAILRSIRVHGKGSDKYDNVRIGLNARLDTMQAAILIEKLKIFADEIAARNRIADRYNLMLGNVSRLTVPTVSQGTTSVWAQYTIRVPAAIRDDLAAALANDGIPTAVYYPKPIHMQMAYRSAPIPNSGVLVSERLATEVLSLPMHPYLTADDQESVVTSVVRAMHQLSKSSSRD